jgi:hypothetical protein
MLANILESNADVVLALGKFRQVYFTGSSHRHSSKHDKHKFFKLISMFFSHTSIPRADEKCANQ